MNRWIKLKEATQYAAICKSRLINLAISGVIRGVKDQCHIKGIEVYSVDVVSAGRRAA